MRNTEPAANTAAAVRALLDYLADVVCPADTEPMTDAARVRVAALLAAHGIPTTTTEGE